MVRIELDDPRGVKGILIDGHMPDFSFLKQLDWEKAKKEILSADPKWTYTWTAPGLDFERTYKKYLKLERDIPNVLMQTAIYSHLIGSIRDRFCPNPDNKIEFCRHRFYPGRGYKSLGHSARFYKGKIYGFKEWIPVQFIYHEIEHEEAMGINNYGFSLLWLNQMPNKECPIFKECQNNWMDFLRFQIKDDSSYYNFHQFKSAAHDFLNNMLEKAIEYHYFFR